MSGSAWLHEHLDAYAQWAITHNSLLIITWDEDNALPVFVKDDCEHPITTLPPHNRIPKGGAWDVRAPSPRCCPAE